MSKEIKYQGLIKADGRVVESPLFVDKSEAQKFVQRYLMSDFVWVEDIYLSNIQCAGEVVEVKEK